MKKVRSILVLSCLIFPLLAYGAHASSEFNGIRITAYYKYDKLISGEDNHSLAHCFVYLENIGNNPLTVLTKLEDREEYDYGPITYTFPFRRTELGRLVKQSLSMFGPVKLKSKEITIIGEFSVKLKDGERIEDVFIDYTIPEIYKDMYDLNAHLWTGELVTKFEKLPD